MRSLREIDMVYGKIEILLFKIIFKHEQDITCDSKKYSVNLNQLKITYNILLIKTKTEQKLTTNYFDW